MACACKAKNDLSYLQRKYGTENKGGKIDTSIRENIWNISKDVLVKLLSILLLPVLILHVIFMVFFRKKHYINITDLIGMRKLKKQNVRG